MFGKIIKLLGIILVGTILFSPTFSALAFVAYISTGNVTSVTPTSATFNGSVNGGSLPTKAWFEWGTNSDFSNAAFTNTYSFNSGYTGNYSSSVSGLNPNTTYSFRTVAQNSQGRVYGNAYSFTTNFSNVDNNISYYLFLTVITEPASSISSTSVQLNSLVYNEANDPSNAWFEWGTTTSLGNKTTAVFVGTLPSVRHANTMTGLLPGTVYYFRAVAENFSKRNNGDTLSFTTSGAKQNTTISTTTNTNTTTKASTPATTEKTTDPALSFLGANAFGSGSFFPTSILEWLLLLILILVLALLAKYLFDQSRDQRTTATPR